ncbi:CAP domain-containing protein [Metabacillus herbersteinensis]|uniref:CAP domain-containing protein n=1 Tax=Metabacillus herbersteinensis TaxID=283816 RepID=A0ABV6GAF3_9BACI
MKKSILLSVAAAATIFTFNGQSADATQLTKEDLQNKIEQATGKSFTFSNEDMNNILKQVDSNQLQQLFGQHFDQANSQFNAYKYEEPKQATPKQEEATHAPEQPKAEAPAPAPKPAQQPSTPPAEKPSTDQVQSSVSAFEQKVVELTNVERQKQGLKPLQLDTELSKVAREKSSDMQRNNYFSHTSPTYGSPFDMMKKYGIDYRAAGENIAMGQRSPEEVVKAWMNSEGHRKNIMSSDFTHIGVGHVAQGNYWTQMFIGK